MGFSPEAVFCLKLFVMAYVDIWVHAVWGTKNRQPVLNENTLPVVCQHIRKNARLKGFYIREIDGADEHLHALMGLKADWSIAKQMQMIKGEAAHWINEESLIRGHFEWADEYFAASVSREKLDVVAAYINNQREHHRKVTFQEEYDEFLREFGFSQG